MNLENEKKPERRGLRNPKPSIPPLALGAIAASVSAAAGSAILAETLKSAPARQEQKAESPSLEADAFIKKLMAAKVGSDRLNTFEHYLVDYLYGEKKEMEPKEGIEKMKKLIESAGMLGAGPDIRDMLLDEYLQRIERMKKPAIPGDHVASLE